MLLVTDQFLAFLPAESVWVKSSCTRRVWGPMAPLFELVDFFGMEIYSTDLENRMLKSLEYADLRNHQYVLLRTSVRLCAVPLCLQTANFPAVTKSKDLTLHNKNSVWRKVQQLSKAMMSGGSVSLRPSSHWRKLKKSWQSWKGGRRRSASLPLQP